MAYPLTLHRETLAQLGRPTSRTGLEMAASKLQCESGAACRPKTTSCNCVGPDAARVAP